MQVPVYSLTGEVVKNIEISDRVFGTPFNEAVVHQAMVRQQANARQGTHKTETRSEVEGSSRKLFRQKHTGRARSGDIRSPLRRGGGITFGPQPRSYRQAMPKAMRNLALRCVLSAKAGDGELKIVEGLQIEEPKTRLMAKALATLGAGKTTLLVTPEADATVIRTSRNLPGVKTLPANLLNVNDVLRFNVLLMTEAAVRRAEQLWGDAQAQGGA